MSEPARALACRCPGRARVRPGDELGGGAHVRTKSLRLDGTGAQCLVLEGARLKPHSFSQLRNGIVISHVFFSNPSPLKFGILVRSKVSSASSVLNGNTCGSSRIFSVRLVKRAASLSAPSRPKWMDAFEFDDAPEFRDEFATGLPQHCQYRHDASARRHEPRRASGQAPQPE